MLKISQDWIAYQQFNEVLEDQERQIESAYTKRLVKYHIIFFFKIHFHYNYYLLLYILLYLIVFDELIFFLYKNILIYIFFNNRNYPRKRKDHYINLYLKIFYH